MENYYAVERIGVSLQHYGVKGMRWGVRKSMALGGEHGAKVLARHYKKASKKLNKLKARADINTQAKEVVAHHKKSIKAAVDTGLAGTIGVATVPKDRFAYATTFVSSPYGSGTYRSVHNLGKSSTQRAAHYISGAATATGLARTAYHTGKAIAAKKRTTPEGHAKAVAKANAWKSEMNKAFAGTKYGNKSSHNKKRKRR